MNASSLAAHGQTDEVYNRLRWGEEPLGAGGTKMHRFILAAVIGSLLVALVSSLWSVGASTQRGPTALNVSGPVSMTTLSATDATAHINIDCCTAVETSTTLAAKQLVGQDKTNPSMLGPKMSALIQALLDTKTPISSCTDDPDCQVNPNRCDFFWQDIGGVTYLIGRNIIVTISWNGDRYQMALRNPC